MVLYTHTVITVTVRLENDVQEVLAEKLDAMDDEDALRWLADLISEDHDINGIVSVDVDVTKDAVTDDTE